MTLNVRMGANEPTNLCSLANENSPQDDECVFRVAPMHWHWDIIKDLSPVPLRWLILILVDSRLMHFNKPGLRSGSVLLCGPRTAHSVSPSWRSIKLFESHVKAVPINLSTLLSLVIKRPSGVFACWPSQAASFPNDEGSCDHQQCCVTPGLRVIRRP